MPLLADLERLADLHTSGVLNDDEFAAAKAALLADGSTEARGDAPDVADATSIPRQQLAELRRANAVAQLDREWDNEREQYTVTAYRSDVDGRSGYPYRYRPTRGGSVIGGIAAIVFGIVWIGVASSMASTMNDMGGGIGIGGMRGPDGYGVVAAPGGIGGIGGLFPILGVVFVLFGIWSSFNAYSKAEGYEDAERNYKHRRASLLAGKSDPGRRRASERRDAAADRNDDGYGAADEAAEGDRDR